MAFKLLPGNFCDLLTFTAFLSVYFLIISKDYFASAATEITATVPVNPVPEGGMLAFHCRIFNLEISHDVAISKTHGSETLRISFAKKILLDDDTRYFLAVRQLSDGSIVYFLSIMEVTREEAGQYSCKVLDVTAVDEKAHDRVDVQVSYLPSDNYPQCAYSGSLTIQSGSLVSYNCSSELGSPNITVEWTRTGGGVVPKARDHYSNTYVTSVLTLQPTMVDSGTVYICTITSRAFPDTKTCHIGPITVTRNPNDVTGRRHYPMITRSTERPPKFPAVDKTKSSASYCKELCDDQEDSLFIWMIATVVAACVAFILLILGVMLCIKLKYRTIEQPQHYVKEDIYAELDKRFDEDAVYMALDRSETEKVYNAYNQTLPRRSDHVGYGNVPTLPAGNTSL